MGKKDGTLAGLAALAGAAYLYNNQKNKDAGKAATAGVDTRAARPESTETRLKTPAQSIADADKSDKSTSISTKGESGTTTPGTDKSEPNLDVKPTPVKPPKVVTGNDLPPADENSTPFQSITRNYKDPKKQEVYDTLNKKSGANTSSALRSDQLANVSRAVNREAKTSKAAQGEFSDYTRTFKNPETQKFNDRVEEQTGANTSSGHKTDALMVASRAARVADAKRRAAKQRGYKSGGMVAKASSASSRADGIASKGKTRGKIC